MLLLVACLLWPVPLSLGCAKPKKDSSADKGSSKSDKKSPIPPAIGYGAGHTVVYQSDTSPLPSFSLAWAEGDAGLAGGSVKTGHLVKPWGHLYTDGKESSRYRADTGDADRDANRLNMDGDVEVRSADEKQTLRSDRGEYRGDVKIVRATGAVVATGPFGTLSGAPELWATPDLKLIGTPDMVSQKLKIPALVALAATAAVGSPRLQKGVTYDTENQGPTLYENLPAGLRVTIRPAKPGPLVIKLLTRGLRLESSGAVVIDFVPKGQDVRHLTASGTVHAVQKAEDGTTTTLDGKDAVYDWNWKAKTETADLDLAGPVTIVRTAKVKNAAGALVSQTTTTKGDQGSAILVNKPKPNQDGLRSATLTGHVTLDVSPVDGQSFSGVGARMVYTPESETANVDATGDVKLTRVSKDPQGTSTVVAQGARGTATLYAKPATGTNPLKRAVMERNVTIDVSGSNGDRFNGSGDRLVVESQGADRSIATMTGDLRFSGDAQSFVGDLSDADTAVMTIGKKGWETVETSNSGGKGTTSTIKLPPPKPKTDPSKADKAKPAKKKGGAA